MTVGVRTESVFAQEGEGDMLPITRVVMFKHGVGYFQRTGKIEGNELIELSFKASQMNDVLKSLTVLDHGGGAFAN